METNEPTVYSPEVQSDQDNPLAKFQAAIEDDPIKGKKGTPAKAKVAPASTIDDFTRALNSDDPVSHMFDGTVNEQDPSKYPFQMKPGLDNDLLRAQNQSFMGDVGRSLLNLVPNIATGIAKSVGQLGTLMQFGDDRTYNNALIQTMDKWHNPFGDNYQEHPNQVFDLKDPAWWLNQGMGLVEMTGQFAALGGGVGSVLEKGAVGLADIIGAGKGLTAGLLGGAQVATSAALSYTIGASMGANVFQQAYANNYAKLLSQGASRDEAQSQAQHIAAQAAASTVQLNTALGFGLNLTSVLPVFKQSDDVIDFFRKGEGARVSGETLSEYKARLNGLAETNPEVRAAIGDTGGLGHRLSEGLKQSAEGVLMHFSEQAGKRIGESGKTKGFFEQFDELGHLLDDAASGEGALNAILGVAGGVLNTAVLEKIPLHSDYVRVNNEPVPVLNPDGTHKTDGEDQPLYEKKLYSSRAMAKNQRMAYFESTRDAIVSDVEHISGKMAEIEALAKANKSDEIQPVLNDLLAVQQLHSIMLGTGDNLIAEYQQMASADNHTDLGVEARKQADTIGEQQQKLLQQEGTNDPQELQGDAADQYAQLDAQKKDLLAQSTKLAGTSEAMQKGFTTSMKDNTYKDRARDASEDITLFQKWNKELARTFGGDPRYLEAHVPEIMLHKQIQAHLYNRLISKLDRENATERAELESQHGPILSTDNFNGIVRDYNRKVAQNSNLANKFNDELAALHKAVNSKDIGAIEGMLAKYKIDYAQGDIAGAAKELSKKLADIRDSKLDQAKLAHQNLADSLEFKLWGDAHPGKDLADYIGELQSRTLQNEALSSKEEYTEQLRAENGILQDQISKAKSKPREYAKSVLKDFDKTRAATMAKTKAENATFVNKDREKAAVENLSNDQRRKAVKVYQAKIDDIEGQIAERSKLLRKAKKGTTLKDKAGKMISWVRDPGEKSLNKEIANLRAQADFFRDKLAKVLLPDNTPEEHISENELTALPNDVSDTLAELSGQINSDLSPDDIRIQLSKMLGNKGIDIATITPDSIDAAIVRALANNKARETQKDASEVTDKLSDLVASTGNPELIREAIDEILNDQKPFSYDALAFHQMMGFVDQPTAAKIMQAVSDMLNLSKRADDKNSITPDEPDTEIPSPTPEPDEPVPFGTEEDTPESGDVISSDEPEAPTPTPDDTSDQVVVGRNTQKDAKPVFHVGAKATDALKINRLDINYNEDVVDNPNGTSKTVFKSISSQVNNVLSEDMLKHGKITPGTKVTFSVDKDWSGRKNVDTALNTTTADDISLYFDKNGKIPNAQNLIDEVPIKIMSGDQVLGYLPRVGWVLAKDPEALNYKHIGNTPEDDNNAQTQADRIRAVRKQIVHFFNSGATDIGTTVISREPAHLIMNVDEKGNVQPRPADKMLPSSSLELGVVDYDNIKTGKKSLSSKTLSISSTDSDWMSQGAPVAMVPMPDGKHSIAPLFNRSIEQYEIKTMLEAVRSYLAGDSKHLDNVSKLTGFDLSKAEDLRNFINQHYTYTNRFSLATLQPSMDINAVPKFMFNITNETGDRKGEISIGTSYSGRDKIVASLQGTQLHPEFVRQFTEGMKGRYKNIVFEDTQRNIKGLNSEGKVNEIVFSNGVMKLRKEHASYNDYVKSFSETPVNGTNKLSNGESVYGVHSTTTMDMASIMSARPNNGGSKRAKVPDASIDVTPAKEPKAKRAKFSAEDASLLDGGFMDEMPSFDKPSGTLESLQELHTFTPDEQHNGKTPQEVLADLKRAGIDRLPPDFNPFIKC